MTKKDEDGVVRFMFFTTCGFLIALSYRIDNVKKIFLLDSILVIIMIGIIIRSVYIHKKNNNISQNKNNKENRDITFYE